MDRVGSRKLDLASVMLEQPLSFLEGVVKSQTGIFLMGSHQGRNVHLVNDANLMDEALRIHYAAFPRGKGAVPLRVLLGDTIQLTDGDEWIQRKRIVQPPYRRPNVSGLVSGINTAIDEAIADVDWERSEVDLEDVSFRIVYTVITRALYGSNANIPFKEIQKELTDALTGIYRKMWEEDCNAEAELLVIVVRLRNRVREMIKGEASTYREHSLLESMRNALRESDNNNVEKRLLDEMMVVLMGGLDISYSILFSLYSLAVHKTYQNEIRVEADEVLNMAAAKHENYVVNDTADFNNKIKLRKLRLAYDETLRLFPPNWIQTRIASKSVELGGALIAEGSLVLFSPYLIHRNRAYWRSPTVYKPEREEFNRPSREVPLSKNFVPFGTSPRLCIGKHVVLLMSQAIILKVLQTVRLNKVLPEELTLSATIPLFPSSKVYVTATRVTPYAQLNHKGS